MKKSLANFAKKISVTRVSTDSRDIRPGTLFFALKGERADGHAFLAEAAEKGASAAVVHKGYQGPNFGLHLIPVDDVLATLQQLAREEIADSGVRVVGITGSVGKTTTKEFIATLLSQKYRVAASPGNSNSQVGLPLSILNGLKENDQILVLEMGMTEPGHLKNLVSIAPPEVALITTIALVHACNFNSLKEIALAKGEILSHPKTKHAFLLLDYFQELNGMCYKESYSTTNSSADYYLTAKGELFVKGQLECYLGKFSLRGEHNRQNLLAAVAAARYFGLELEEIVAGVQQLALPERRLQNVLKNGIQFVNDSYNACAVSMKAAFNSLPKPKKGSKTIAVLGEMLELGKFSIECHQEVGKDSLPVFDHMICFGEECLPIVKCWEKAKKPVSWTCDRKELMRVFRQLVKPGDVVLLKGSRSKELWRVIEEL